MRGLIRPYRQGLRSGLIGLNPRGRGSSNFDEDAYEKAMAALGTKTIWLRPDKSPAPEGQPVGAMYPVPNSGTGPAFDAPVGTYLWSLDPNRGVHKCIYASNEQSLLRPSVNYTLDQATSPYQDGYLLLAVEQRFGIQTTGDSLNGRTLFGVSFNDFNIAPNSREFAMNSRDDVPSSRYIRTGVLYPQGEIYVLAVYIGSFRINLNGKIPPVNTAGGFTHPQGFGGSALFMARNTPNCALFAYEYCVVPLYPGHTLVDAAVTQLMAKYGIEP